MQQNSTNSIAFQKQIPEELSEEIIVFKYKRPLNEQSWDEIRVHNNKKIKQNEQSTSSSNSSPQQKIVDPEQVLENMFNRMSLRQNLCANSKEKEQGDQTSEFFLKKLEIDKESDLFKQSSQITLKAHDAVRRQRHLKNNEKFNQNRGITSESEKVKRRVKYKIVDIKDDNFVEFGNGQQYKYEDFSQQINEMKQNEENSHYDYYVLNKGRLKNDVFGRQSKQILLPSEVQYLLEEEMEYEEENQQIVKKQSDGEDSDSNCSDRQEYDYPEEDYDFNAKEDTDSIGNGQSKSSRSSQDIIEGNFRGGKASKKGGDWSESDQNLDNSYRQEDFEDEEEYYRQYLKRCKKYEEGDDNYTYLYRKEGEKYTYDREQQQQLDEQL